MGAIWLLDAPEALRDHGVEVDLYPGWETRSRSSGGLEAVYATGLHHDAFRRGVTLKQRAAYAWDFASSRPIGHGIINRRGRVLMGAAGATNTQGRSERSFAMSKGRIPRSQGNLYMTSWETMCDGVGQVFTEDQCNTVIKVCGAMADLAGLAATDLLSHHTYTERKIDPKGRAMGYPSWASDYEEWDDLAVIDDLELYLEQRGLNTMWIAPNRQRLVDTRPGKEALLPYDMSVPAYTQYRIPKHPDVPATARGITMTVTVVSPVGDGYVAVWPDGETFTASCLNYQERVNLANTTQVQLAADGSFKLLTSQQTHLIIDVLSYQT